MSNKLFSIVSKKGLSKKYFVNTVTLEKAFLNRK
jgi:hypothetical protein